jgi:phosphohistidine phosphatase
VRRLLVLRHAKSSWGEPALADHDRPLNARGERAAALVGARLAQSPQLPDLVLCSTAVRARETAARVLAALPEPPPVRFEEVLYLADPCVWIERLQRVDDTVGCVLVVGHNPGLEDLVAALLGDAKESARRRLAHGLPTAALAELELPIATWAALERGVGRLVAFTRPRDLV